MIIYVDIKFNLIYIKIKTKEKEVNGEMKKSEFQITLQAARINAGFSRIQVANYMKVSLWNVIEWETGKREVAISEAKRLSKYYGISLDNISWPCSSKEI